MAVPGSSKPGTTIPPPLISLGTGRTGRTRWSCGAGRSRRSGWSGRTGRSSRPGKAAILYHHVFLILPRGDLDDARGGKLRSNPPEPSSCSALHLHCFARADLDLYVGLARPPNPSYDYQFAPRYGGSRNQYFCMRSFRPRDCTGNCGSGDRTDELCMHGKVSCHNRRLNH